MKLRRAAILAAAALLPLTAQTAGTTGLSSYLSQIPPPPRNSEEAYQASVVDDAKVLAGELVEIQTPPKFRDLETKLGAEGTLAAGQNPSAAGANPAAIAAMQNMSPAQQQAMAQQMAAQMGGGAQATGTFTPGDRQVVILLQQRQEGSMSRAQDDMRAHTEWAETQHRFDDEHLALSQRQEAERAAGGFNKCQASQAAERRWADDHVKLMDQQLMAGLAAYDKRRILAVDYTGFADRLSTHEKQMQSMVTKGGYSDARVQAVLQLGAAAAISEDLYRRAAYWHMFRRSLTPNRCDS
ncbi:MAG TPA: hypothetical protein VM074_01455 [Solimonas sp.]|nr:hypothetical protein [Solimonas sp.]